MIDDKRLTEIQRHLKDAEFGYGVMDNRVYFKDVKALLDERKELLQQRSVAMGLASEESKKLAAAETQFMSASADCGKLGAENSELRRELENHRQLAKEVIAEEQS